MLVSPLKEGQGELQAGKLTFRSGNLVAFDGFGITATQDTGLTLSFLTPDSSDSKRISKIDQGKLIIKTQRHVYAGGRFQAKGAAGELEIIMVKGETVK